MRTKGGGKYHKGMDGMGVGVKVEEDADGKESGVSK